MSNLVIFSTEDILNPKNHNFNDGGVHVEAIGTSNIKALPEDLKTLKKLYNKIKSPYGEDFEELEKVIVYLLKKTKKESSNSVIPGDDAEWDKHVWLVKEYVEKTFYPDYFLEEDETDLDPAEYEKLITLVEQYKEGKKNVLPQILDFENAMSSGILYGLYDVIEKKRYNLKKLRKDYSTESSRKYTRLSSVLDKLYNR